MDSQKSPPPSSDKDDISSPQDNANDAADMAALVANQPFTPAPTDPRAASAASSGVGKTRYRPAPAKTFQCRGYGECRMVFSRSEHLARHIRYVPARPTRVFPLPPPPYASFSLSQPPASPRP